MSKEITTRASQEIMEQLKQSFPTDPGVNRIMLPRLSMASQDKTEGKGKAMKVVTEAGTFFIERQSDEIDEETGKKIWTKEEIGKNFEGIILYQRKQLRYYDDSTQTYTSSPIYDEDDEVVPLWCNKAEVARGTPAELKKQYMYTDKEGKEKSKLEDNKILYVLYNGEVFQMNLRGSSMYSFKAYARKFVPNTVLTAFSSEAKEKGSIAWNQMEFKAVRELNQEEAEAVIAKLSEIATSIKMEKATYVKAEKVDELDEMVNAATKQLE